MNDLDLSYNEYAKCPYCGYEDEDCFELQDDDNGRTECPECGKEYGYSTEITRTFSTWALDEILKGDSNE